MNVYEKIRSFCRKFRITIGLIAIAIAILFSNPWWYLGIIPLIAGLADFVQFVSYQKNVIYLKMEQNHNGNNII